MHILKCMMCWTSNDREYYHLGNNSFSPETMLSSTKLTLLPNLKMKWLTMGKAWLSSNDLYMHSLTKKHHIYVPGKMNSLHKVWTWWTPQTEVIKTELGVVSRVSRERVSGVPIFSLPPVMGELNEETFSPKKQAEEVPITQREINSPLAFCKNIHRRYTLVVDNCATIDNSGYSFR